MCLFFYIFLLTVFALRSFSFLSLGLSRYNIIVTAHPHPTPLSFFFFFSYYSSGSCSVRSSPSDKRINFGFAITVSVSGRPPCWGCASPLHWSSAVAVDGAVRPHAVPVLLRWRLVVALVGSRLVGVGRHLCTNAARTVKHYFLLERHVVGFVGVPRAIVLPVVAALPKQDHPHCNNRSGRCKCAGESEDKCLVMSRRCFGGCTAEPGENSFGEQVGTVRLWCVPDAIAGQVEGGTTDCQRTYNTKFEDQQTARCIEAGKQGWRENGQPTNQPTPLLCTYGRFR